MRNHGRAFEEYQRELNSLGGQVAKEREATAAYHNSSPDNLRRGDQQLQRQVEHYREMSAGIEKKLQEYQSETNAMVRDSNSPKRSPIKEHPQESLVTSKKRPVPKEFINKIDEQINEKERNLERLKMKIQEEDDQDCTFMPEISNNSRQIINNLSYQPIHKRYQEEVENKQARMQKKRDLQQEKKVEAENKNMGAHKQHSKDGTLSTQGSYVQDIFSAQRGLPSHERRKKDVGVYEANKEWLNQKNDRLEQQRMKCMIDALETKEQVPDLGYTRSYNQKQVKGSFWDRQQSYLDKKEKRTINRDHHYQDLANISKINKQSARIVRRIREKESMVQDQESEFNDNYFRDDISQTQSRNQSELSQSQVIPRTTLSKAERTEARSRLYGSQNKPDKDVIVVSLHRKNQDAELTKLQMKSTHMQRMRDSKREVPLNKINYIEMSPETNELVQALKIDQQ